MYHHILEQQHLNPYTAFTIKIVGITNVSHRTFNSSFLICHNSKPNNMIPFYLKRQAK